METLCGLVSETIPVMHITVSLGLVSLWRKLLRPSLEVLASE